MKPAQPGDLFPPPQRRLRIVSLQEEKLERKLALSFGFMSFIPILILVWVKIVEADLSVALYGIVASVFVGYFVVAKGMIRSILRVTDHIRRLSSDPTKGELAIEEQNEIGELARAFNRITTELQQKIDELESSRQLVKKLLSRIGTAMVSYQGIDNLLNLILENMVAALEAQMGSLMLVDGENQELVLKTTWMSNGQAAELASRIKMGEGLVGMVGKEGRAVRGTGTPAALGFSDVYREEGAILCVPLTLRDQPIGVVSVFRPDSTRSFSEDDQTLVANVSSQVAVAVENYRLNMDVERTYVETIMALALAVEAKDPYSAGHSKRVGFYAMKIAEAMGLDAEFQQVLNHAGMLHDIGKIGIKDSILLKTEPLTPEEERIMHQHAVIGEAIVKPVHSLQKVGQLVLHHHERFDGTGYPANLQRDTIPLGARILAVADSYDAMVTDRPYRKRLSFEAANAELRKCAGTLFDPQVVQAFLKVLADRQQRQAAGKDHDPA